MQRMESKNPRKQYRRVRLKWLLLFLIIGILIVGKGMKEIKEEEKGQELQQGSEQSKIRDDFQYLEESPDIRVVLMAGEYEGIYHSRAEVKFPDGGYVLVCENNQWGFPFLTTK